MTNHETKKPKSKQGGEELAEDELEAVAAGCDYVVTCEPPKVTQKFSTSTGSPEVVAPDPRGARSV